MSSIRFEEMQERYKNEHISAESLAKLVFIGTKLPEKGITAEEYETITGEEYEH